MPYRRTFHSHSIRREDWDYRRSAWYFITICTDRRLPYFGKVRDGIMGLAPAGCVAARYWQKIAELNDRVVLDAFVVMPNHVHGLLGLMPRQNVDASPEGGSSDPNESASRSTTNRPRASNTAKDLDEYMSRISPEAGSVSVIVRSYKTAVTKRVRGTILTDFGWQSRFDDHIVRSEPAFYHIRRYIQNNPARWERDRNHPKQMEA